MRYILEIWMVREIFISFQVEMGYVLLENRGNVIHVIMCSNVLWEVELGSDEIGNVGEKISKPNIKDVP